MDYPLLKWEEKYYLAGCPHKGRPLREVDVNGDVVRCPYHGAVFSLRDCSLLSPPVSKTPCPERCSLISFDPQTGRFSRDPFVPQESPRVEGRQ